MGGEESVCGHFDVSEGRVLAMTQCSADRIAVKTLRRCVLSGGVWVELWW